MTDLSQHRIAVMFPCYNEEATIADCVRNFRAALPMAAIYVYDNNSTDATTARAREAGAIVRTEPQKGKGNVMRRMFADIEADIYVLADGDNTYHAPSAPAMIARLIEENLDMVAGARVADESDLAYRRGHRLGNFMLTWFVSFLFGNRFSDMLTGYRIFSRRFIKSFPAMAAGFETESELTVHALSLGLPVAEMPTPYGSRPEGSTSKLSTYKDGLRILKAILTLFKDERPLAFFSLLAAALAIGAIILIVPVIVYFLQTGLVPRLPTAVFSASLMILSFLSMACGMILDTVSTGRREVKRLHYLQHKSPQP